MNITKLGKITLHTTANITANTYQKQRSGSNERWPGHQKQSCFLALLNQTRACLRWLYVGR